ncbi:biliverdin-producing heme oxygenase [Stutzerimonas stutzeri]|uniref:biliverdin-producing heme oxygenase n=1 Tax=Stutzerimonas stutzeri TaxID=316 RepID=UPI00210EBC84|nr:biliverdin-producing heme oxygenase [Stutzerimonas stutzeri]MCQ4260370.1 biliverdin-producing heme oxygenase [Stutzerimonas stutzeri]
MTSMRQWIRETSAPWHEQVDAAYSRFDLSNRHDYGGFLRAHAAALFGLEAALEQGGIIHLLPDWPARRRSAALREDLRSLQIALPAPLSLKPCTDEGWYWGVAYVLEGSRLGGRVLSQRVRNGGTGSPLQYLSHGEGVPLWPRFLEHFEQRAETTDRDQLLAGVQLAFEQFLSAAEQELRVLATAQP